MQIAPGHDPDRLAPILARAGRIHIPGALPAGEAERLAATLETETPWRRAVGGAAKAWDVPLDALSEAKAAELASAAHAQARKGFQFLFDVWRLSDEVDAGRRRGHPAERFYDALNGPTFLDFLRRITGAEEIAFADAQATRYLPGHFLTAHDDHVSGKGRLFAYVLNLSRTWQADWGGLLLFHDADGHIAEGYTPAFNSLNLFRVPQRHSVSLVAPFAGAPRLSITGWIRARL